MILVLPQGFQILRCNLLFTFVNFPINFRQLRNELRQLDILVHILHNQCIHLD